MTYDPLADRDFNAPVRGNATLWPSLIANDAEVFEQFAPGFEASVATTANALSREFRWRMYGNLDNADLTIGVRGTGVSGPHTVTIATPGVDSDTVSVGAANWYSATLAAAGPRQEVIVSSAALGGGTLEFSGLRAHHAYSAPSAGTRYPSGFRLIGSDWGTSGYAVPSEIQNRHRTNPARLAKDRPICVAAHIADTIKAVATKSPDVWGAYDETRFERIGRLWVPRCDDGRRFFRVDVYTNETTPGTAEYAVKVGSREERWSGPGWHSWRVELGAQRHEVIASVMAGASNGAAIRTLTVWRTEL